MKLESLPVSDLVLDPRYVDVIIERWETLTGNKAVLENASR